MQRVRNENTPLAATMSNPLTHVLRGLGLRQTTQQ